MFITKNNIKYKKKSTTEIICQNLAVNNQTIFQDYKCTLKSNISYFGRLYIGEEHLMFVSNIFGIVKKFAIVIDTISKLHQPVLNTIVINAKTEKESREQEFIFNGFKNKNAFKLIKALWKKEKLSSEVLNSNQQQLESSQKISTGKGLDDANTQINLFNPEIVQTEKQKMLEIILPCSVEQFFAFFIGDNATVYSKKKHLQFKKGIKVVVSPWAKNAEMNADYRQITAIIKVKGVPFQSEATLNQIWLLQFHTSEQIKCKAITQMMDVPYCSYFHIEQQLHIIKQTDNKCRYICHSAVVFNKATYMKSTILKRSFEDLQEDYKIWGDNVKEILQKMKKSNEESQLKNEKRSTKLDIQYQINKAQSQRILIQPQISSHQLESSLKGLQLSIDKMNKRMVKLQRLVYCLMLMILINMMIGLLPFGLSQVGNL